MLALRACIPACSAGEHALDDELDGSHGYLTLMDRTVTLLTMDRTVTHSTLSQEEREELLQTQSERDHMRLVLDKHADSSHQLAQLQHQVSKLPAGRLEPRLCASRCALLRPAPARVPACCICVAHMRAGAHKEQSLGD